MSPINAHQNVLKKCLVCILVNSSLMLVLSTFIQANILVAFLSFVLMISSLYFHAHSLPKLQSQLSLSLTVLIQLGLGLLVSWELSFMLCHESSRQKNNSPSDTYSGLSF